MTLNSRLASARPVAAAAIRPIDAPAANSVSAAANDERDDFPAARAEREPDAELALALSDAVGDHAVDADAGQQQRDARKRAQERRLQPALTPPIDRQQPRACARRRPAARDRSTGWPRRSIRPRAPRDRPCVRTTSACAVLRELLVAPVHLRPPVVVEAFVPDVAGDADDRVPAQIGHHSNGHGRMEPAADWIGIAEKSVSPAARR